MFNSLKYAKQLIEAGFSREQAEAQMQIMTDLLETKIAMKDDLNRVEASLRADFNQLRAEMNHRFEMVSADFKILEKSLTIKMGVIVAVVPPVVLGIVTAIAKFAGPFV